MRLDGQVDSEVDRTFPYMLADSPTDHPNDTDPEGTAGTRMKLWLLLEADRWSVTAVLLFGVFITLVVIGRLDPSTLRSLMEAKDPVETLFQPLLAAIITGVTLVVTINQLVLSQELGAVGDQRSRMNDAVDFRTEVEEALDLEVAPPAPARFLQTLVDGSATCADRLADTIGELPEDAHGEISSYVNELTANAEEVSHDLEEAEFGTFEVISAALDYNYSWKLYEGRRLMEIYGEVLPEAGRSALDQLIETLTLYGPAREHFKTLYFQWHLINLSRAILYSAVPAIVVTTTAILYVDAGVVSGRTMGVDHLVWLVAALATTALTPFMLLLSYVLRISTVAKRTLAIGPFILLDEARSDDLEGGPSG